MKKPVSHLCNARKQDTAIHLQPHDTDQAEPYTSLVAIRASCGCLWKQTGALFARSWRLQGMTCRSHVFVTWATRGESWIRFMYGPSGSRHAVSQFLLFICKFRLSLSLQSARDEHYVEFLDHLQQER